MGRMTYEDFKTFTPDDELHVLFAEDGFEGIDSGAKEGFQSI